MNLCERLCEFAGYIFKFYINIYNKIVLILFILVIILILLFVFVYDSRRKLKEINRMNEECIRYQKDYYEKIIKSDEEMRAFRHDINKHYNILGELIRLECFDDAKRYIETLVEIKNINYIYHTGNAVADYIINAKIPEINKNNDVNVEVIGRFPENISVDDTDMNIIMGNALDNAADALKVADGDKELHIKIRHHMNIIYLTVMNSSNEVDVNNLKTHKGDKINHGYGIKNIKRVVCKYKGNINIKYEKNLFCLNVEICI